MTEVSKSTLFKVKTIFFLVNEIAIISNFYYLSKLVEKIRIYGLKKMFFILCFTTGYTSNNQDAKINTEITLTVKQLLRLAVYVIPNNN